jgi:hypothetical protein
MKRTLLMVLLAAMPALAADDNEWERLLSCFSPFKPISCATTLFTDHPFHISASSLAPGNGFGAGGAFTFSFHPKEKHITGPDGVSITTKSWRTTLDGDAVASSNKSWRAGIYLTALYTVQPPTVVVQGLAPAGGADLRPKSWLFNSYVETDSLNKLTFYGIGQDSLRSNLSYYGMRETVAGGNTALPLGRRLNFRLFAEANARVVDLRSNTTEGGPSIEQIFTPVTAPGLGDQKAFGQFGEGIRLAPTIGPRLSLNYAMTFQEYAAPGKSSFERLVVDLGHEFQLHGKSVPKPPSFNGPNSCARADGNNSDCPKPTMSENVEGSLSFRFLLNQSFVPSGNAVPFYFQPTLGGGNINGENTLPTYADYRFRGPDLMLFRGTFEHSLGKLPVGFIFMADAGKVAMNAGDLRFSNLTKSFAAGLTLHAGGFPVLSFLFAFGGNEGTHPLAQVNSSLLGGGGRPSLY